MKLIFKPSLFALLCFGLSLSVAAQKVLPQATLKNIDNERVEVTQLVQTGKPTIVSFFATWCKPCLRELNAIAEVYDDWQTETGVQLIAVSIDEGSHSFKVKPLVKAQGWDYTVLLDPNGTLKRAMQVTVVPTVFVLNGKGEIVYRHTGYAEGGEQELYRVVKETLAK